jgi:hypothetical protein
MTPEQQKAFDAAYGNSEDQALAEAVWLAACAWQRAEDARICREIAELTPTITSDGSACDATSQAGRSRQAGCEILPKFGGNLCRLNLRRAL